MNDDSNSRKQNSDSNPGCSTHVQTLSESPIPAHHQLKVDQSSINEEETSDTTWPCTNDHTDSDPNNEKPDVYSSSLCYSALNRLEPERVKKLMVEYKKAIHRHTFRAQRAAQHHEFLSSCRDYNRFPMGLSFQKNVNIMKGGQGALPHTSIDDIMARATLSVAECLINYYEVLINEEMRL